jgi:hypothetical protein
MIRDEKRTLQSFLCSVKKGAVGGEKKKEHFQGRKPQRTDRQTE